MINLIKSTFHHEQKTKELLSEFILNSSILSMNKECLNFEATFAKKQQRKYAVMVNSGSSANLSVNERFDISSNDFAPLDSPKVGIYFSPTDVVNEDILLSFANLDFNQYLGDPRDNFKLNYPELKDVANQYFQKYTGKNDFWDYMRLIKYYDQMMFTQIRKLIPARSKPHLGTVIEPNLFEVSFFSILISSSTGFL